MYVPTRAPSNINQVPAYLDSEHANIAQSLIGPQEYAYLVTLHVEPKKPREGMIVKADGSDWNPGSGAGIYFYNGTSWQLLTAASLITGLATLTTGSAAVSYPAITASTRVFLSAATPGGTQGFLSYALTVGVGFTINSTSATDSSTVAYLIV